MPPAIFRDALLCALLLSAAAPAHAAEKIVIVDIDEGTKRALGPFGPSYRAHHAKILENLLGFGARAIGFNMDMSENPDPVAQAGAKKFADAVETARKNGTAVVIARWIEPIEGREAFTVEDNAKVLDQVPQSSTLYRYEALLRPGQEPPYAQGPVVLPIEVEGLRWLGVELAVRAGAADMGAVKKLCAPVVVGQYKSGAPVLVDSIRPALGKPGEIEKISYADVLDPKPGSAHGARLKDAFVLVGDADEENPAGSLAAPDPARPDLKRLSTLHLAAFGLKTILDGPTPPPAQAPPKALSLPEGLLKNPFDR